MIVYERACDGPTRCRDRSLRVGHLYINKRYRSYSFVTCTWHIPHIYDSATYQFYHLRFVQARSTLEALVTDLEIAFLVLVETM